MACSPITTNLSFPEYEPDFSLIMGQVREFNTGSADCGVTGFPELTYLQQVTDDSQWIDEDHMEVRPEDKKFVQYNLHAYVTVQPKRQELSKFGLDEPRDILVYPSLPILEDAGLVTQVNAEYANGSFKEDIKPTRLAGGNLLFGINPEDRVWFQHQLYTVLNWYEDRFFGNTSIPLYLVLACNRYRRNSRDLD